MRKPGHAFAAAHAEQYSRRGADRACRHSDGGAERYCDGDGNRDSYGSNGASHPTPCIDPGSCPHCYARRSGHST